MDPKTPIEETTVAAVEITAADDTKYVVETTIPAKVDRKEVDIAERKGRILEIEEGIKSAQLTIDTLTQEKTEIEAELANAAAVAAKALPIKLK